jgi:hypothetical protein
MQAKTTRGIPVCHTFVLSSLMPYLDPTKKRDVVLSAIKELDSNKETILFKNEYLPLIEEVDIPLDQIKTFLIHQNKSGNTPLHDEERLKRLLPTLEQLDPKDLADLLCVQNSLGQTPVHTLTDYTWAKVLIERLSPEDCIRVYNIKDCRGNIAKVTFTQKYLDSFDKNALITLLKITPLHLLTINNFKMFGALFKSKFSLDDIDALVTLKLPSGDGIFDIPDVMVELVHLVREMNGDVLEYLKRKNKANQICIHNVVMCKVVLPHLISIDPELAMNALLIRDDKGNSALHTRVILDIAKPLVDLLKYDLSKCVNLAHLSPINRVEFLDGWMKSYKVRGGIHEPLKESEYDARALKAENEVLSIFDALHFSQEGGINPEFLFSGNKQKLTKEKIIQQKAAVRVALVEILQKIKEKRVYLGTPEASDRRGLHLFYSEMLLNLEQIVTFIKGQEANVQAGTIVQLASVEMEGRCAAAHQAEIRQRADCCMLNMGNSKISLDSIIRGALNNGLIRIVEEVLKLRSSSSDVHIFTRLLFSVGLVMSDDPLCKSLDVDEAFALINSRMNFHEYFNGLEKDLAPEYVDEFVRNLIPLDYDKEFALQDARPSSYKKLMHDVSTQERALFETFQGLCLALGCPEENKAPLMSFFKEYRSANLNQLKKVLEQETDLEKANAVLIKQEQEECDKTTFKNPLQKRMKLQNLVISQKQRSDAILTVQNKLDQLGIRREEHVKIVDAFISYQTALIALAEQFPEDSDGEGAEALHFSFSLNTQILPSRAIELARQLKHNESLDTSKVRLMRLLEHFGVIRIV